MDGQPKLMAQLPRRDMLLYAALALFVAALLLDGVFGAHGLIASYRVRLQVQSEGQTIRQLDQENREFARQVRELKTDPSAVERVAHQNMGLVKPGDLVFELPRDPAKTAPAPAPLPARR